MAAQAAVRRARSNGQMWWKDGVEPVTLPRREGSRVQFDCRAVTLLPGVFYLVLVNEEELNLHQKPAFVPQGAFKVQSLTVTQLNK